MVIEDLEFSGLADPAPVLVRGSAEECDGVGEASGDVAILVFGESFADGELAEPDLGGFAFGFGSVDPAEEGSSRLSAIRECENSLKRLGTDWIDSYQVHSFDDTAPMEETLGALNMLVQQGRVRYVGVSNYAGWQIAKAHGICERLGFERPCSVQAYYSLAGR